MKNPLLETETYKNWYKYGAAHERIPVTWTQEDLNLDWQLTYQTDEIPEGDEWQICSTDLKKQQEALFNEWGITKEATTHWMALNPELNENLSKILLSFKLTNYRYNFLKLTAGRMLQWHIDGYSTFVKHNNVAAHRWKEINRSVVMMNDWNFGQVIQIGRRVITEWEAGDVYTWTGDTWHGAANFGVDDLTVMQITYLDE
jgi:hypothetical protein